MKSFAVAAIALASASSALAQLTINTPISPVVCQPLLITWTGGTPPYFLSLVPGSQPGAAAILDFGTLNTNSLTWTVNVTAGTSLGLNLRDSTGNLAQSAAFTIQSSPNTACLTGTPVPISPGAPNTGSPSPTVAPPVSTSGAGTTPTSPPVTRPATGSTTSGASAAPTSTGAAAKTYGQLGVGLLGAAVAVIAALA